MGNNTSICSPGNVTYSCFDDDLNSTHVTAARWTTSDPDSALATAVVLLVFMLVAIPCNLLIIVTMLWKRLYRQPAHFLLLNLAVNDFLMSVTYIPINLISALAREFIFGGNDVTRCHFCQTGVIFVVFSQFNLHIIALIALDRLLYFRYPMKYHTLVTVYTTVIMVVLLWVFCILISIPPLFKFGEIRFTQSISTCTLYLLGRTDVTYNIFYEVFSILEAVFVPIPVLLVCNLGVVTIVCKQLKKMYQEARPGGMAADDRSLSVKINREKNHKQLRIAKVYGAILISNLVTWTPNVLNLVVIFVFCQEPFVVPHGFFTSNYLFFVSSVVVHPLLQTCLIPDIRDTIARLFCRRARHLPPTLGQGASSRGLLDSHSERSLCVCCGRCRVREGSGRSLNRKMSNSTTLTTTVIHNCDSPFPTRLKLNLGTEQSSSLSDVTKQLHTSQ